MLSLRSLPVSSTRVSWGAWLGRTVWRESISLAGQVLPTAGTGSIGCRAARVAWRAACRLVCQHADTALAVEVSAEARVRGVKLGAAGLQLGAAAGRLVRHGLFLVHAEALHVADEVLVTVAVQADASPALNAVGRRVDHVVGGVNRDKCIAFADAAGAREGGVRAAVLVAAGLVLRWRRRIHAAGLHTHTLGLVDPVCEPFGTAHMHGAASHCQAMWSSCDNCN